MKNGTHLIATRETCALRSAMEHAMMEFREAHSEGLNIPDCSVLPEEQNICSSTSSSGMLFY